MVANKYRWDFIGLSTYTKPTPETSDKVADGSTYYESDTSKLYIWYKDNWYEKTVSGGGSYVLPVSSASTLGGIKTVESFGLNISDSGELKGRIYDSTNYDSMWNDAIVSKGTLEYALSQASPSITPVQTTGTSTTDVMSQNATTEMVFSDDTKTRIKIGHNVTLNNAGNSQYVAIGAGSTVSYSGTAIGASANAGYYGVAIASGTSSSQSAVAGENAVAIGARTGANGQQSVALGYGATASSKGQFDIGCGIYTTAGYNDSAYRLLSGLYDGQNAHDAATVGQINATIDAINTALSTNIPHIGA